MDWPFVGTEAVAAGAVTRHELATRYAAIYRNVYIPRGHQATCSEGACCLVVVATPSNRRQRVGRGHARREMDRLALTGRAQPAEPAQDQRHCAASRQLLPDEIKVVRAIDVATAPRTAFDLGRRCGRTLAVIRVDSLLQATALELAEIDALIDGHRGAREIVQLREVVRLADLARSRRRKHVPACC